MAEANFGPIPMGLSLSFEFVQDDWMSEIDCGEKSVKSVGKTGFWQHCNFVRSFGSKEDSQTDKIGGESKNRKIINHVSRNNSIASSTGSMNSEVTELSSSQFEHEKDVIERKSCCLCILL